jgi:hypothetical protein
VYYRGALRAKRAIGDDAYGAIDNIRSLANAGILDYLPLLDCDTLTPYCGASHFAYNPARHDYRCPQD